MNFENPRIPEGINSGRNRPLRDLVVLGGGTAAILLAATFLILMAGQLLGPLVPFSWERSLAGSFSVATDEASAREVRLQALADRIAGAMDLPEGMAITTHLIPYGMPNAYATLGGHVFVTEGLLEEMPDENALAWVIGHEVAHVRNRDVMRVMTGTMLVSLFASLATGDNSFGEMVLGGGSLMGTLRFSRSREAQADADSLAAMVALYGHAGGYRDAFGVLREAASKAGIEEPPTLLASHPAIEDRIAALEADIAGQHWPMDGARTPLFDPDPAQ